MVAALDNQRSLRRGGSASLHLALFIVFNSIVTLFLIIIDYTRIYPMMWCIISFFLLIFPVFQLHLHEISLERLARGFPVHQHSSPLRWPLTHLFVLVEAASHLLGSQTQRELRNVVYEDQLVQQVSKTAAQEERNRLARDLHDTIKQQIFSIVVSAAAVKARWESNPSSAWKIVNDIETIAQEAQVEMQALLLQLRPVALENVGLIEALRMQCQALTYRTGAQVETDFSELPSEEQLPPGTQETIFRIVQEGFANIARHARASKVWLSLQRQHDTLLIEIGDNGQGFDLASQAERPGKDGGMGLCNIRERVKALDGNVAIWSQMGQGTTIHLTIPLAKSSRLIRVEMQEQVSKELTNAIQKARRTMSIGRRVVELGVALLLLYASSDFVNLVLIACTITSLFLWLWAQQYRMQAGFDLAPDHAQSYYLRAKNYFLLCGITFLTAITLFHLLFYPYYSIPNNLLLAILILYGIFFTCTITFFLLGSRGMYRYYQALPIDNRKSVVRRYSYQMIIDWIALLATTVVALTLGLLWINLPMRGGVHLSITILTTLALIAWFIVNSEKSLRVMRWRYRLLH